MVGRIEEATIPSGSHVLITAEMTSCLILPAPVAHAQASEVEGHPSTPDLAIHPTFDKNMTATITLYFEKGP